MISFQYNTNRHGSFPEYRSQVDKMPDTHPLPLPVPEPAQTAGVTWHSLPVEEVIRHLRSAREGLTELEALLRLQQTGPNRLPEAKAVPPLVRFLRQFRDVLVGILLLAGIVTACLGDWKGTLVILAVVLLNALIGFWQEGKAQAALASLRQLLAPETTVLRNNVRKKIPASGLVPGDVVQLEAGDRVPADLRIITAKNAQADEAMLTGESFPVEKQTAPVASEAPLAERKSMAYSGTLLTRGSLSGIVVATGTQTELGGISQLVSRVETASTPLLEKMNRFGQRLSLVILVVSALLFAYGWIFTGYASRDLFLLTVGLAVAAIPEGLPAVLTIILALGVQRMARRQAIVRRLPAVETLGAVTVICTDKTGTLTQNEMTVREVVLADERYQVDGAGYLPMGSFWQEKKRVEALQRPLLAELLRVGLLSSEAELRQDGAGNWRLEGDPTEGALVVLAHKAGLFRRQLDLFYTRLDAMPFDSEHKFTAALYQTGEREKVIFLKGAPEVIFAKCRWAQATTGRWPFLLPYWQDRIESLTRQGYRVLAIAQKQTSSSNLEEELPDGFNLLGLVGIIDPPRPEAVEAVRECRQAGIRVKMITGDHAETARAIGTQLGINQSVRVITGPLLDQLDEAALQAAAAEYDVFARTTPAHKLRLVAALQAQGEVVAMTGDGVNDAPALKRADVGIAMGAKGSEAAREASEVVLTDDNFATIGQAVAEGRTIYDNLRKAVLFLFPTNGAQALTVLLAVVISLPQLPITPLQILWVNMVTAVTLSLALAFEPAESGVMNRPPRRRSAPFLTGPLLGRIALVSGLIGGLSVGLFFLALRQGAPLAQAQTLAVNTLVFGQMGYLFSSRLLERSSLSLRSLLANRVAMICAVVLLLVQGLFTYLPLFHQWMGTSALSGADWLYALAAGVVVFGLAEGEKVLRRRLQWRRKQRQANLA